MDAAILLDGDFTRRLVRKKLDHAPSPSEIERYCRSVLQQNETVKKAYYYDCSPFHEQRTLPVSGKTIDFSRSNVFKRATLFQKDILKNPFFDYRRGQLSFDGWILKRKSVMGLLKAPRALNDNDFSPLFSQKQVDMKIGFDVAKLSINNSVQRILLATSDADFVPAIHFAKTYGVEVVLLSDADFVKRTKGSLLKSFNSHRLV